MPVLVALKVGTTPPMGLLCASRSVIVTVEVLVPFAVTEPVPVMVEVAELGAPAMNVTVPPFTLTGPLMCKVFTSAFVDVMVQVETPNEVDEEQVL